jgi:hypothetical protein
LTVEEARTLPGYMPPTPEALARGVRLRSTALDEDYRQVVASFCEVTRLHFGLSVDDVLNVFTTVGLSDDEVLDTVSFIEDLTRICR